MRALLVAFGLLFSAGAAWFAFAADFPGLGIVLVVVAATALFDLVWVLYRKQRGEPG